MKIFENALLSFFCIFTIIPNFSRGDCTDAKDEGANHNEIIKTKCSAIASILIASAIGVCIPLLGKKIHPALQPEKNIFLMIKAFAAGVILATAFIHVLPEAFEDLTSPCLKENPWGKFPFPGFVAMMAAIGTLMVDSIATSYFNKSLAQNQIDGGHELAELIDTQATHEVDVLADRQATHGHSHGSLDSNAAESQLLRHRVISKVLELGIVVHSVIIGISLGASQSAETIRPLLVALSFHQLFEGMGLGGCIAQARESRLTTITMVLFFSLTTPVGIGIGIAISSIYKENSPTALVLEGLFNAASAGILIYLSLVNLLAADFMNPKMQKNVKLQVGANASLLFGAGCMSLLAIWA